MSGRSISVDHWTCVGERSFSELGKQTRQNKLYFVALTDRSACANVADSV